METINAKKEILEFLKEDSVVNKKIKCAIINYDNKHSEIDDDEHVFILKINHTNDDFKSFLSQLNFKFEYGWGTSMLYGSIWFEDGSWATRTESDYGEGWEHKKVPQIPSLLF